MKSFILALVACVALTSCNNHNDEKKELVKHLVTSPIVLDTILTKDYVAQINSIKHIELRAIERGYLKSIAVDEGQYVRKGQSMFSIMPNIFQADLQKAQAEAEVAHIEYKNTKLLADGNVVSKNELAMAKAKYDKARAEVSLASTHLGFTNIRAPFDGIIDHFHAREGSLLDEGELLTTLSDNSKMWVYFNVPEAEYLNYMMHNKEGSTKEVSLLLANSVEFNQKGIVETIEGEFNNQTGNIAFRATFDNPEKILRHGETGNVIMRIPIRNAMIIPQRATFEVLEKLFVFVIDKNNIVRQREIKVGAELPDLFVISKGLQTSDKIMLEGIRLVKDGEKIAYKQISARKAMASLNMYAE